MEPKGESQLEAPVDMAIGQTGFSDSRGMLRPGPAEERAMMSTQDLEFFTWWCLLSEFVDGAYETYRTFI